MTWESKAHAFDTNLGPRYNRTWVHSIGLSPKRSRFWQMPQLRQMRGRFKIANLPQTSKLGRSPLSFERGSCGRCGSLLENSPPPELTDSTNLMQINQSNTLSFRRRPESRAEGTGGENNCNNRKVYQPGPPKLLAAMREIARKEGRQFDGVLVDSMWESLKSKLGPEVRPEVMAHFYASLERNRRLGELLAQ